jgi:hypothetical protein
VSPRPGRCRVVLITLLLGACAGGESPGADHPEASPPSGSTTADAAADSAPPDAPAAPVDGRPPDLAATDATNATVAMTWTFRKCCPTDGLVLIRLLDKSTGQQKMVGPLANPGDTASATLTCAPGAQICWGAYEAGSISGSQPLHWCLGQNETAERPDCCRPCSDQTIRTQLDCPQGLPGACF